MTIVLMASSNFNKHIFKTRRKTDRARADLQAHSDLSLILMRVVKIHTETRSAMCSNENAHDK